MTDAERDEIRRLDEADFAFICQAIGRLYVRRLERRGWRPNSVYSTAVKAMERVFEVNVGTLSPGAQAYLAPELAEVAAVFEAVKRVEGRHPDVWRI